MTQFAAPGCDVTAWYFRADPTCALCTGAETMRAAPPPVPGLLDLPPQEAAARARRERQKVEGREKVRAKRAI
jgi:hypothetical protein